MMLPCGAAITRPHRAPITRSRRAAMTWPRSAAALRLAVPLLFCAACTKRPAAPILNFHAVGDGDGFAVPLETFRAELDALRAFRAIPLHELLRGPPPQPAVVLTFDDGTEDAVSVVLPELVKRKLTATFFITTGFIADDEAHRHVEEGVRYLIWPEVLALRSAGMEIGSHTIDHARLPDLEDARIREELVQSKRVLEEHLQAPVDLFAYPYNSVRGKARAAVIAAGYSAAVAGEVHGSDDRFQLYRISVQRGTTVAELQQKLERWAR